jgi:hypothetical protein
LKYEHKDNKSIIDYISKKYLLFKIKSIEKYNDFYKIIYDCNYMNLIYKDIFINISYDGCLLNGILPVYFEKIFNNKYKILIINQDFIVSSYVGGNYPQNGGNYLKKINNNYLNGGSRISFNAVLEEQQKIELKQTNTEETDKTSQERAKLVKQPLKEGTGTEPEPPEPPEAQEQSETVKKVTNQTKKGHNTGEGEETVERGEAEAPSVPQENKEDITTLTEQPTKEETSEKPGEPLDNNSIEDRLSKLEDLLKGIKNQLGITPFDGSTCTNVIIEPLNSTPTDILNVDDTENSLKHENIVKLSQLLRLLNTKDTLYNFEKGNDSAYEWIPTGDSKSELGNLNLLYQRLLLLSAIPLNNKEKLLLSAIFQNIKNKTDVNTKINKLEMLYNILEITP